MNAIVIFTSSKQEQRTLVFLGEVRCGCHVISQERTTAHAAFLGFHLHDCILSLKSSVSSYRRFQYGNFRKSNLTSLKSHMSIVEIVMSVGLLGHAVIKITHG